MGIGLNFKQEDGSTDATDLQEIKNVIYEDNSGNKYTFGVDNSNVFNNFKYKSSSGNPVDYSDLAKDFMNKGSVDTLLSKLKVIDEVKTETGKIADIATKAAKLDAIETAVNDANLKSKLADIAAIKTDVGAIKTETNKIESIKTKTDTIDTSTLAKTSDLTDIKTAVNDANLKDKLADIALIKAKTDAIDLSTLAKDSDLTAIKAKTDNMPDNLKTELGSLAKTSELNTLAKDADLKLVKTETAKIAGIETKAAKLDAIETAVSQTNLQNKLLDIAEIKTNVETIKSETNKIAAIKAKTDNMPDNLKTELGSLAKTSELTEIKTATDKIADIKTKVDIIDLSTLAKEASIATLSSNIQQGSASGSKLADALESFDNTLKQQGSFDKAVFSKINEALSALGDNDIIPDYIIDSAIW